MAKYDPKDIKAAKKALQELYAVELNRLETSDKINASFDSYFQTLKNIPQVQDLINEKQGILNDLNEQLKTAQGIEKVALEEIIKEKEKELKLEQAKLNMQKEELNLLKAAFGSLKKKTDEIIKQNFAYDKMVDYLLDIDKEIKKAALSMGLVGANAEMFRSNLETASTYAATLGVSVGEVARSSAAFSKELKHKLVVKEWC